MKSLFVRCDIITHMLWDIFSESLILFFQKIILGSMFILGFLGIQTQVQQVPIAEGVETPAVVFPETKIQEVPESTQQTPAAVLAETQENGGITIEVPLPIPTLINKQAADTMEQIAPAPATSFIPQAQLNEAARKVVVNVFCLTKTTGVFDPITGSGVIIDERGVILTNAHVAQYLLLKDYLVKDFLHCVIRGGSPAIPLYKAELLYMPAAWIEKNAQNIKLDSPTGTGENDYALLLIAESTRAGEPLPESFPSIEFDALNEDMRINDPVLLASYPAGFLGGFDITRNLWITSSVASIMKLYTFQDVFPYTLDGFSVGGTVLAQAGASGGGVFSLKSGKLIGLLSTSVLEGSTDKRDLRAISLFHINESIKKYTGEDLRTFLSGDLKQKSTEFNRTINPTLTKMITDELDKR